MKILVTGCFGFIGYNFINYLKKNNIDHIGVDSLESSSSKQLYKINSDENLSKYFDLNIKDLNENKDLKKLNISTIVNFAAETHVDNSIGNPESFIDSNILGVTKLLRFAIENNIENVIQISTDEVYGSVLDEFCDESSELNPSSPYSASKASAELICKSFIKTYGVNVKMVRPANNYGKFQQPEKLIPYSVANLIHEKNIEIYGEGRQIRHWLHVEDTVEAILAVIEKGKENEIYNVGSGEYSENIEIAKQLLSILGLDENRLEFVDERPGHDFRYAIDCTKIRNIGWSPKRSLKFELEKTVSWYMDNKDFWIDDYKIINQKRKKRMHL
tara:strand:+ start:1130 stop:2119 length:990 start_codon:yes stop_codon:yes gene_type:complete